MKTRLTPIVLVVVVLTGIAISAWFVVDRDALKGVGVIGQPLRAPVARDARSQQLVTVGTVDSSPQAATTTEHDWLRSYHQSTDDLSLTRDLARAAMLGDARAEFVLGHVLLRCEIVKRTLSPYAKGTLRERVDQYLIDQPNLALLGGEEFRQRATRCEGMLDENALSEAGLEVDARDFRYWAMRAVDSGDPLAAMEHAGRLVAGRSERLNGDAERMYREDVMKDVRTAVASKEAAALFAVGTLFSHPSVVANPDHGYAWQVAACESGYDCSNANPEIGLGCVGDSSCVDDLTWQDKMQRDFGASRYAAIYAVALDIQYKVRTDDWDGLQQYLKIK